MRISDWVQTCALPICDGRARIGLQHDPCLVLAARIAPRLGALIVGMNLNGQIFAGEQIFDEQFRLASVGHLKPDFPNRLAAVPHDIERGTNSDKPRVGTECVSTCRSRGSPYT